MTSPSLSPEGYARARRALMRRDPVLGAIIKHIGPCLMADRQRKDHLSALVGAIVSQQLSTKAAATIFGRFVALFPDHHISDAAAIAALDDPTLRGVGLSGQKVGYLRDLSARIQDGRLKLDELEALDDQEVTARLVAGTVPITLHRFSPAWRTLGPAWPWLSGPGCSSSSWG